MAATALNAETENESRAVVVLNRTVRENWAWESDGVSDTESLFKLLLEEIKSLKERVAALEDDMKTAEEIFQSQEKAGLLKRI
jgi:hypothetical protein